MDTSFINIENSIKSLVTSSLSCSYIGSEVRLASTGPNSYTKTLYLKFEIDNGVRLTFSVTEDNDVEVLFIGKRGHFSINDYLNKFSIQLTVAKIDSSVEKVIKYLDFINKDNTLCLTLKGQKWPEIPCSFGGMK
jgi:hypothetical protein